MAKDMKALTTKVMTILPIIIFLACGLAPTASFSKTLYLDCQIGSDTNSGLSASSPKKDFHRSDKNDGAADIAAAGDTILVKRGTSCNFTQSQPINKSVHITSNASFFSRTAADALPILSSYSVWTEGWQNQGNNIWIHTIPWPGQPTPIHYVRFSALGINHAGPAQFSLRDLKGPKSYFYYLGTSANDPPYVAVYSNGDPSIFYGPIYYSYNSIFWFTNAGNGYDVSSGMSVDYLIFQNTDIGIGVFPLDANFAGGNIKNIQCVDVHRCLLIEGNGQQGDTLSNFNVNSDTITGTSGPAIQVNGIDKLQQVVISNLNIKTTGVSESYGGIYTAAINSNSSATYNDFQIKNNHFSDCQTGNLYIADGACIENDMRSLAVLITENIISDSHQCYHSNSGGAKGTQTQPSHGLYFMYNLCKDTDTLALTSDSEKIGNALIYIKNNTLLNGSINKYYAQVPFSNSLIPIFNQTAVGIHIGYNKINLSFSLAGQYYGIGNAMMSPSYVSMAGNIFSSNISKNYNYMGGGK